jgi:hypothetical protein
MSSKAWTCWRLCRKRRTIEVPGRIFRPFFHGLLDVAALDNCRKSIRKLVHHDLSQIVALDIRDVSVTHAVFGDEHVVSQSCCISCSSGNANVCLRLLKSAIRPPAVRCSTQPIQKLTIYPVNTIFAPAPSPRNSCKSVSANELGWFFPITFSPSLGFSSSNSSANFESGVKTGAPSGVW